MTYKSDHGPYNLPNLVMAVFVGKEAIGEPLLSNSEVAQLEQLNVPVISVKSLVK